MAVADTVVVQVFVGESDSEVQSVAALREVFKGALQAEAVAARGFAAVVLAVEDVALPLAVLGADREIARAEGCARREKSRRFDAAEGGDVIERGFQGLAFDGCAFFECMGEPLDFRVADGGAVFDLDLAVASGEDADGERAVRI